MLKTQCGVKKGDRVVIYMPTSPIAVAAILACARIGAVHWYVYTSSLLCNYLFTYFSYYSVLYSVLSASHLERRIKACENICTYIGPAPA